MIPMIPLTPKNRLRRACRRSCTVSLWMGTLLCCALGAGARAAHAGETPTPLAAAASATPQLRMPQGEPQKLVTPPPAPAAAGAAAPATARGEGRVAADRPLAFLFQAATTGLYSIGVSSPQNAARIAIFLGDSKKPESGTALSDGAIRWSSDLSAGAKVKIVVYTAGGEIPFRVEASGGPGGL